MQWPISFFKSTTLPGSLWVKNMSVWPLLLDLTLVRWRVEALVKVTLFETASLTWVRGVISTVSYFSCLPRLWWSWNRCFEQDLGSNFGAHPWRSILGPLKEKDQEVPPTLAPKLVPKSDHNWGKYFSNALRPSRIKVVLKPLKRDMIGKLWC